MASAKVPQDKDIPMIPSLLNIYTKPPPAADVSLNKNIDDEMLAKAKALSLEDVEDKKIGYSMSFSHDVTKPPPAPASGSSCITSVTYLSDGEWTTKFNPTPTKITPKDRDLAEKALLGTIKGLNSEKSFGFIDTKQPLTKEYKGNSLFFHFDVVKNLSNDTVVLQRGMNVKFIPYKGSFEKPKAFAVFLHNEYEGCNVKAQKKRPEKKEKRGKKSTCKHLNKADMKCTQLTLLLEYRGRFLA